jgi:hypothetical protein
MEPMETGNYLLMAVYSGYKRLHLTRPVTEGDLLAIGSEPAELENVLVIKTEPPGHIAYLAEPLKRFWPVGTIVGVVVPI